MADSITSFGDPASIQTVGTDAQQAASKLDQLKALVNSNVTDTVPDRWGGAAATKFDHFWYRFNVAIADLGSPLGNYGEALQDAAATMSKARQLLQQAQEFCDANGLYLKPDLTVESRPPSRPDDPIRKQAGQVQVDAAAQVAEQARQQIRAANAKLEVDAEEAVRELAEIVVAMAMVAGRRGGGRKTPPGTSVWTMGWSRRGFEIEKRLGAGKLPRSFPTIDKFENGVATSIKSVDLSARTYQNPDALTSTLRGYVDKVAGFNGANWDGTVIRGSDVTGRTLQVAIPPGVASPAQQSALDQVRQYATSKGVQLIISEVP